MTNGMLNQACIAGMGHTGVASGQHRCSPLAVSARGRHLKSTCAFAGLLGQHGGAPTPHKCALHLKLLSPSLHFAGTRNLWATFVDIMLLCMRSQYMKLFWPIVCSRLTEIDPALGRLPGDCMLQSMSGRGTVNTWMWRSIGRWHKCCLGHNHVKRLVRPQMSSCNL